MEILGGPLFAAAGAGESHGPAVTSIVFGCPPGQYLRRQAIQKYLDRRRPGSNRHGTPRNEKDKVVLLSHLQQYQNELRVVAAYEAIRCRSLKGLDHKTLVDEMFLSHDLDNDQVDDLINEMLDRGLIYEPLLGIYKIA